MAFEVVSAALNAGERDEKRAKFSDPKGVNAAGSGQDLRV
jgi:hypothetical protein